MKGKVLPPGLVWGILAVVVIVVAFFMYRSFLAPPAQVDIKTISPTRLEDPDPRSGSKLPN